MFQTFLTQFHLNCSHPSALFGQFTQFTYSWFLGRDLIFQPSLTLTSINHGSILSLEIPDMREKKNKFRRCCIYSRTQIACYVKAKLCFTLNQTPVLITDAIYLFLF